MKKKLFLVAAMVALLVCVLAVSVSAAVTGSSSNEYGEVASYDIAAKDKLDTTSRVVLKNADDTYTTYPAYYVLKNQASGAFDFSALNTATGESYSRTSVARIEFPDGITSISGSMFDGDKELVEVDFPAKFTSVGSRAFYDCSNLQYIDGTDGLLIFPEGFTTISANNAFYNCDKIKYVEFPSTFTYLGQAAFNDCDGLLLVSFDKVNEAIANGTRTKRVDFNNCGVFKNCDNLAVMSIPELTTVVINRFASNCPNLTAVYMPNSVQQIGTNGTGGKTSNNLGAFDYCEKMYFVQESFTVSQCLVNGDIDLTKLRLPEKPSVYYMPTSFTGFIGHIESNASSKDGTVFRSCVSLNDTIVFGTNFTYFNANNVFQDMGTADSPKNVVFLADMTQFITLQNSKYISIYFVNPADKSPADIGISRYVVANNVTDSYAYFCNGGARYTYAIPKESLSTEIEANLAYVLATKDTQNVSHVAQRQGAAEATCTLPAGTHTFCFCGQVISTVAEEGSVALGHNLIVENGAVDLGIVYLDYFASGVHSVVCARCNETCTAETDALFIHKGYSVSTFGAMSMVQGFMLNNGALEAYVQYATDFEFGLIAAGNANGEAFAPSLDSVFCVPQRVLAHDYFEIKITGITTELEDTRIVFCAYVKVDGKVLYLDNNTTSGMLTGFSYNEVLKLVG